MGQKNKTFVGIFVFLFLIVLIMYFVLAAHVITPSSGETSFSVNEGTTNLYNIIVNNSDVGQDANITQVNITFSEHFDVSVETNGTDSSSAFSNDDLVLSWTNTSGYVINGSEVKYFWVNATALEPGFYNITITTTNATGSYSSNISVTVNGFVSECNTSLEISNIIYTLNQSISAWNLGDCISIGADNVTLNCNGYNIIYGGDDYSYYGIDNTDGYDNITIKNCIISQNGSAPAQHAISFTESKNAVIFNNTITTLGGLPQLENGSYGIILDTDSTGANITSNTINTSGTYGIGIFLGNSSNATIDNNVIITSGDYADGLHIDSSLNNNLTLNNITTSGHDADGIYNLGNCSSSLIYNNTITTSGNNNSDGIYLGEDSQYMNIASNTITTSATGGIGIYLEGDSNLVYSNIITTAGFEGDGIYINYASNNNLTNNILNTTNGYAIWVQEATGTHVNDTNHTIENNTEQGDIIYYLFNNDSGIIQNKNVGEIIVANSNNLTLDNLTLGRDGIIFLYTDNSTIKNSNITISGLGIFSGLVLSYSHYNNITNNTITTSRTGVDGIYVEGANHSTFTKNKIHVTGLGAFVIYSALSGNNTFYNNLFNASTINSLSTSGFGYLGDNAPEDFIWNTTKTSGTNIIGKTYIGGNFWTNNNGNGYSDTCIDADGDYICDDSYGLGNDTADYLPLTTYTTQISDCRSITLSNATHTLNQSFSATGTCIQIQTNNIILDFNGHNITGNTTGYGINISNYNGTTIKDGFIYNFSTGIYLKNNQDNNIENMTINENEINGIYINTSSSNTFTDININNSKQDAILLEGNMSDDNNFTAVVVTNTNSSYYDINFNTAGIDGTWIIDISNFANYSFAGAGGKVNFKEPSYGEIKFLQAINGSGISLASDVDIESNLIFVNSSSNSGLNKSANITLYSINYTDPKPQYSSDGTTFTDCTTTTNPACNEIGFSGNNFIFNTTHFTYFQSAEAYVTISDDSPSSSSSSGGGTFSFWTLTYIVNDEQFLEGYTKELSKKHRIKLNINNEDHYVGVIDLTDTTLKINVSSTPQQAVLSIGDIRRFDVAENGYYDLSVLLNSIENNKANVTIKSVYEKVTEETDKQEEEKEKVAQEQKEIEEEEEESSLTWLWILIGIIVLVMIIGGGIVVSKRRK